MALIFEIKVVPCSGRTGWVLDKNDHLKCYLKSPAQQGKANAELIKDIAKRLSITQLMVAIIAGSQSKNKRIKVDVDISYDKLLELLGVDRQMNIF
jgi:uncharacterized protein (TIGR00251 family)